MTLYSVPKVFLPVVLLTVLGGCVSYDDRYDDRHRSARVVGEPGQDRVLVCHKGKKTMELPASALNGHMNHGDRRGPC